MGLFPIVVKGGGGGGEEEGRHIGDFLLSLLFLAMLTRREVRSSLVRRGV